MLPPISPVAALKAAIADRSITPIEIALATVTHANGNASQNTYIHFDADALLCDAATLPKDTPLYGIPISLKDLFDLEGTVTTAGSKFYASRQSVSTTDAALTARIKQSGALITGKTNLHPLAYGVTGENNDYGDCLQPRDATLLTGGSSSGAVASVQEGSALAAIGTDTGGSIRIPAALSGLCGYRASHALPTLFPELWSGGVHLSPSFDTIGLFTRDPRDLAPIAQALFFPPGSPSQSVSSIEVGSAPQNPRIGCVSPAFAHDANPDVLAAYAAWKQHLEQSGATIEEFDATPWADSTEIYAAIQAHEAYLMHRDYLDDLLPTLETRIAERLRWGASITPTELNFLRARHQQFRAAVARLFAEFDFLMLPSMPLTRLVAGEDFTAARPAILRYTSPFSLAGVPVVTLPGELLGAPFGTGIQLAAPALADATLLAYAASL